MDVFETSQYVIEMGTWPLSKMERILHVYNTKLNPYGTTGGKTSKKDKDDIS